MTDTAAPDSAKPSNEESWKKNQQETFKIIESKAYVDNPELLPWYHKEFVEPIKPVTKELFQEYSKVPPEEFEAHVKHVRDVAFKIYPYPCLGHWGFLNLNISNNPVYPEVIERLKNGEKLLDLGCCMGQDTRKMVFDAGSDVSRNLYAADIKRDFWDFSFDMFRDKDSLKTTFIEADILNPDSDLNQLDGTLDMVYTSSFYHLFDLETQTKAIRRTIKLLKPIAGVMVFGRQGGVENPVEFNNLKKEMTSYWHNADTWTQLWEKIGEETSTKWKVDVELGGEDMTRRMKSNLVPAGTRFLTFNIKRVA